MVISNNSPKTTYTYLTSVKELMLHFQKLPEECSVDELKAFLVYQKEKLELSSSTVNLRVCGLKYYFRNVVNRLDLVVKIPNPRISKYHVDILSVQELKLLFSRCRDMRQLLIISLLYETGLRSFEVARLMTNWFSKTESTITIYNSKGKKIRVVEYGTTLRSVLAQYCKVRGSVPKYTLIDSYKELDTPLTVRGIQHIVKEVTKRSGIKKRISPHTFRHTFAVHYLNRGGSIFRLQLLLGHKHLSTTLHYLKYATLPDGNRLSLLDMMKHEQAYV
jgi:integrase/recombinase XerD